MISQSLVVSDELSRGRARKTYFCTGESGFISRRNLRVPAVSVLGERKKKDVALLTSTFQNRERERERNNASSEGGKGSWRD